MRLGHDLTLQASQGAGEVGASRWIRRSSHSVAIEDDAAGHPATGQWRAIALLGHEAKQATA